MFNFEKKAACYSNDRFLRNQPRSVWHSRVNMYGQVVVREKRNTETWRRSSDMRHVGAEKEKVYEKCGHRNTRGGRDQTKPKINVLHLLGQFAPSVGCRTGYTSSSGGRFVPFAERTLSLSISLTVCLSFSHPWRITRKENSESEWKKIRGMIKLLTDSCKFQHNEYRRAIIDFSSVY